MKKIFFILFLILGISVFAGNVGGGGTSSSGDMTKAVYDVNDNGVVDNSEKLNDKLFSDYSINDLGDVFLSTPTNGQFLKYDGTNWVNSDLPSNVMLEGENVSLLNNDAGYMKSSTYDTNSDNIVDDSEKLNGKVFSDYLLNDLGDTNITTPADGEVLKYDGTLGKWINGIGGSSFDYKASFSQYSNSDLTASETSFLSDEILIDTGVLPTISHIYLLSSDTDTDTSTVYYELYQGTLTGYETALKGYWKLEETSGTRYDETDNNNDLTDNNTVGYGEGKYGNAAYFIRANSEYLSISDANQTGLDFAGSSMTIACWVKASSTGIAQLPGGKWSSTSGSGYFLGVTSGDLFYFQLRDSAGNLAQPQSTTSMIANTWYHIVGVWNTDTDTAKIYINGTEEGSNSWSYELEDSTNDFYIGNAYSAYYWDGYIDEFAVWGRALSSDEVSTLYSDGVDVVALGWDYTTKVADLTPGQDNAVSISNTTGRYKLKVIGSGNLDFRGFTIFFK